MKTCAPILLDVQALGDFAGGFSVPQSFGNQEGQIDRSYEEGNVQT